MFAFPFSSRFLKRHQGFNAGLQGPSSCWGPCYSSHIGKHCDTEQKRIPSLTILLVTVRPTVHHRWVTSFYCGFIDCLQRCRPPRNVRRGPQLGVYTPQTNMEPLKDPDNGSA